MFQTNTSYLIPRFGKSEAEKKVFFFLVFLFPYFRELGANFIITTKLGVFLTVSDYSQPKRHARKKKVFMAYCLSYHSKISFLLSLLKYISFLCPTILNTQ